MQKTPSRRSFPLPDRIIEVVDDTLTGEVLLDEALKMMKTSEKMSVSSWIDLMSGTPVQLLYTRRGHAQLTHDPGWQARHGTS
jgi:Golgi phosphoprotein 3